MSEPITRPVAVPPVVRASSGTRVRSPRDPAIGDVVEGYELLSLLSSGETLVFVARRAEDERRVVLRLPSARGEDKAVALVANEAAFGTRVDHPQVVRVLARGRFGGRTFVVREHVGGLSLQTVLDALARRARRLEAPLAGMIALRLARALAALHGATTPSQRGLLYGDLHPSNVLVSANGHVRLADLASVRPLPLIGPTEPAPPRFPAEPYAAPEALEGAAADERADVFALAALLVRLLAGHEPPMHRPASVWAFDVLADEPPALRRLLVASLDRDPANRLPTAAAFAEALAAAMPTAASWTEADLVRSLRGSPRSEPVVGLRASTPPPPPPEPVDLGPADDVDDARGDARGVDDARAAVAAAPSAPPVQRTLEPRRSSRAPAMGTERAEDATRPLRPDELGRGAPRSAEDTARTLLDRALSKDPTPTPRPLPALTIDGVGDAPVPLFRFVAFFAFAAFAALVGAAVWYFTRR